MFKQRKNKSFNYRPRFSKEEDVNSNLEKSNEKDFASKWKQGSKRKVRGTLSVGTLIFVLVLLLICMYLLEKKYM
ncbi:hypothetical protein [Thalassobellus suaedae]|uniref:Uncharacterized protein n=1 Tax=Thalassobellus suaedae TaxID=3074124 RepID=A0ABY9XTY7_9FLAO|nr:hypothetical protein RHP51_01130 [Flavobacteriaceae bacterium HL-DH14]